MRLSIVLASYNGERYVREQLESLAAQTRPADEVILSDDCSNDATAQIADQFAQAHAGWKLVRRACNGGYKRNFYDALAQATGDVVFLCDQDDVWDAGKLAAFEAFFKSHPQAQAVVSDYELVDAQLAPIPGAQCARFAEKYAMGEDGRLSLLRRDPLLFAHGSVAPGCCMAVTRAVRDRYLQISECKMPHDWEMAIIADAMDGLYAMDAKLTRYRQHGNNEIGLSTGAQPLHMRGTLDKRMEVHGHFEGVAHALECCAQGLVSGKLLAAMRGYCEARRAFLETPGLARLAKVYRYCGVYTRAIDLRGRLGDIKIAMKR